MVIQTHTYTHKYNTTQPEASTLLRLHNVSNTKWNKIERNSFVNSRTHTCPSKTLWLWLLWCSPYGMYTIYDLLCTLYAAASASHSHTHKHTPHHTHAYLFLCKCIRFTLTASSNSFRFNGVHWFIVNSLIRKSVVVQLFN